MLMIIFDRRKKNNESDFQASQFKQSDTCKVFRYSLTSFSNISSKRKCFEYVETGKYVFLANNFLTVNYF